MRNSYERLSLFVKLNFAITSVLFCAFLIFNDYTLETFLYTLLAAFSTAAILYFVIYIFIAPLFWLKKKILIFAALVFGITNLLLFVDFFIFRLWGFHINGMVLNILVSPAAYDSVKMGWSANLIVIFIICGLIYSQYFLFKHVSNKEIDKVKKHNRKFIIWIAPVLVLLVFSEKVISGFAIMYANVPLLERTKSIPLYIGVDFTRDMEKYFGLKANTSEKHDFSISEKSRVNYPLEPLKIDKANPVNIFVFAMDSTRYDVVNKDVTPNITEFSKDSWVYHNHFSGGNTTRFGIFSLWYGLNSNYWFSFLNAQKGPVFFDVLNQLDYQTHIFSSASTVWPEFRKTTFFSIQDKISDHYEELGHVKKDIASSNGFISWLSTIDKKKPVFSFVFLDAPHSPYSFPEEYNKYKSKNTSASTPNYLSLSAKDGARLFARYKNANFFNDALVHKMITALKEHELYENSIIIITSDHGEEFYEYGTYGHNNAFNRSQAQVPFIVHWPKGGHKNIQEMTSHLDMVPTILTYLGVKTAPEKYSMGRNLLSDNLDRDFVFVGNWNNNSMVTDEYTYVFNNVNFFESKVYSTKTYKVVSAPDDGSKEKILLNVMEETARFIN